jgi:TonB family protein
MAIARSVLGAATLGVVLLPTCTGLLSHPFESPTAVLRYLADVTGRVRLKLGYPCVADLAAIICEHKEAKVVVQFGMLSDGSLQFATIHESAGAGLEAYDAAAVKAFEESSPFPAMPPEVVAALTKGSVGMPPVFRFNAPISFTKSPPSPPRASSGDARSRRSGLSDGQDHHG